MSSLFLKSTLVLGLAGAALGAPAPAPLHRRQETVEASPTDAAGVLSAALSTFAAAETTTTPVVDASSIVNAASVVASAVASTVPTPEETEGELEEADDVQQTTSATDTDLSRDEFCDETGLDDLDTVIGIWNDRGIARYLDDFLSKDNYANEDNWVVKMAGPAFKGTGTSGGWTCGKLDLDCFKNTQTNCNDMFDRGFGYEYWIFKAVQNLQNTMENAHRELVESVTGDLIDIPIINKDFAVELKDTNALLKFIGAAFGMAGGLVAFGRFESAAGKLWRDDAKASATLFGGSFAASAAQTPPKPADASVDMYKALRDIFDDQLANIDSWLSLATGGEGDKNGLPDRGKVEGGDPKSAISGFFAQGRFILANDDPAEYFTQAYKFITMKMVDVALDTFGYKFLADHNQEDEGMCAEQPYAYWTNIPDVGDRCMRIVYKEGGDSNIYSPASEDILKRIEGYGFDIKKYHDATMDCALNGGDDRMVDLETIPENGDPPKCFFNLPFMDAEIWLHGDNPDDDDDWVIGWPISFKEVQSW